MTARLRGALARALPSVPPASGAVVMGTGIVSIDLSLGGHTVPSQILLWLAVCSWLAIGSLLGARLARDRATLLEEARSPASLTGVAGTAVLGTRIVLAGVDWLGALLLVVALALWLALAPGVLRSWRTPAVGASFVLVVSTESLAVLAAALALSQGIAWLVVAAMVPFVLGLAFYLFVVSHFDLRQLAIGHGDHWVAGGALAISALAAARIAIAAPEVGVLAGAEGALDAIAIAVWIAALVWLPVLLAAEARWPRWRYDVRRWSTVFPVGMYAACSFFEASASGWGAVDTFARAWTWPALAVWAIVFAAMLRRVATALAPAARG